MRLRIIIKNGSYVHNKLVSVRKGGTSHPGSHEGGWMLTVRQAVEMMGSIIPALTAAAAIVFFMAGISSAAAESGRNFSIHTSSYKTEKGALVDIKSLRAKGYDAYFRKTAVPGKGVWYRVYVGGYESRDKATKAATAMKKGGLVTFVSVERRQKPPAKGRADEPVKSRKETAKPAPEKVREAGKERKDAARPAPAPAKPAGSADGNKTALAAGSGKNAPAPAKASPPPPEVKQNVENRPVASTTSAPAQPPAAAPAVAAPQAPTGNPLYDEAMRDFQAGQYEKAVISLKKLNSARLTDPAMRESVLRRLADAHYFLGEKKGKQDYFSASDYYKQILNDYPDPRAGNDLVYDRLSRCHETLRFYYEALQTLEKLISRYPGSPHVGDAMFRSGEVLNKNGKMDKAVEKYVAYVKQYPNGTHARNASYIIGDCYYRLGQSENAETWFTFARNRWPELSELPKYIVIDLGYHKYRSRKFSEAVDVFSQYVSLYPADEWAKSVAMALGRSLAEMGQETTALKVFGQVIERYPDSREAVEAAVAMASIGVEKPGLRVPWYMAGADNYRDPIIAYGLLLRKHPEADLVELILNQKGNALAKLGNHREAVDTSLELLRMNPKGNFRSEALRTFRASALYLVNDGYGKGDYVAVSDLYYRVALHGMLKDMDFDTLFKIGESLKMIGLNNDALSVFNDLSKMSTTLQNENRTIIAMAEIEKMTGRDKDAEQKLLGILNQSKQKDAGAYRSARAMIADILYNRGSYDDAIKSYREVLMKSGETEETMSAYENYADALRAKDMCSQASQNYQKVIDAAGREGAKYPARMVAGAYMGLGDCLFKEKRLNEGMAMYEQGMKYIAADDRKMWSVYRIAREAMKASNYPLAEKSFAQLKASGDSAFWTKITEYTLESGKWSDRHAAYLKKQ